MTDTEVVERHRLSTGRLNWLIERCIVKKIDLQRIRGDSGKPIQANSQDVPTYFRCRKTTDVNILNFDGIGNKASLDLKTDCGLFWRESTFFHIYKFAAPRVLIGNN